MVPSCRRLLARPTTHHRVLVSGRLVVLRLRDILAPRQSSPTSPWMLPVTHEPQAAAARVGAARLCARSGTAECPVAQPRVEALLAQQPSSRGMFFTLWRAHFAHTRTHSRHTLCNLSCQGHPLTVPRAPAAYGDSMQKYARSRRKLAKAGRPSENMHAARRRDGCENMQTVTNTVVLGSQTHLLRQETIESPSQFYFARRPWPL